MVNSATIRPDLATHLLEHIRARSLFATTVELGKNEIVYDGFADDRSIYLVEHGKVKTVVHTRTGKRCLLNIYATGDVLGESCLLGAQRPEGTTAITMTDTVLHRIPGAAARAALTDARLSAEFLRYVIGRVLDQQRMIADLLTENSESRLAAILLRLGRRFGIRRTNLLRIEDRITQEELAAMVGTTRSRVGHFLKGFQESGLVERDDMGFLVVNEPRMRHFLAGTAESVPAALDHDSAPHPRQPDRVELD